MQVITIGCVFFPEDAEKADTDHWLSHFWSALASLQDLRSVDFGSFDSANGPLSSSQHISLLTQIR
jgi:hypothetical protein